MDEQRAEFEAWASHFFTRGELDRHGINGARPDEYRVLHIERMWGAWQAATQRQQERIAELEAQVATLTTALFECREAFHIPEPGSPLEPAWMGAMTDPEDVPEYVKAQVQALSLDAGRLDWLDQTRDFAVARTNKSVAPTHSKVKLFSIPSQHIVANTFREAIDAAIAAGKAI